jgi:hypothetical protein
MDRIHMSAEVVHFIYPLSDDSPPKHRIACMPNMEEFHRTAYHDNYLRSNDPRGVNCPACKRTEVYKGAIARVP